MGWFNRIVALFLSLRLTVVALLLLSVLVVVGTLYQVDYGLYTAQQRFFNSWIILFFGFIPFPGGQTVMTALFLNLFANMMIRFQYGWRQSGIIMIHLGFILLLAGGWVTRKFGVESFLSLLEGEGSNLSSSYTEWEVAAWRETPGVVRQVYAYTIDAAAPDWELSFDELGITLTVEHYYRHARAVRATDPDVASRVLNSSGITFLEGERPKWEPQENVPGGLFTLRAEDGTSARLLLFGGDEKPTTFRHNDDIITLALRRKRYELPMMVSLINFDKSFHPNSDIPRSFASFVEVDLQGVTRDVLIEMNRPFRYHGYTFYQASYADMDHGQQLSTFAIVLNYGRVIPYLSTAITFLGLVVHFLIELVRHRRVAS